MTTPDNGRVPDSPVPPAADPAVSEPRAVQRAPSRYRARRRRDWIIAGVIALVCALVGGALYLTSDIRAVTSDTGADFDSPEPMATVPKTLTQAWERAIPAGGFAAVSSLGSVAVSDQHTISGLDAQTGEQRWTYGRSNRNLCAVGSGDIAETTIQRPHNDGSDSDPRGIMAVYAHGDLCSEMVLLDPRTGARRYQRTAPNLPGGMLTFGGPYAAWYGSDRLEIWRWDLVRTLQYGDLPAPDQPGNVHQGCTFLDAAVTNDIVATLENCSKQPELTVVLNWTDPNTHDKSDSPLKHRPLATINTRSTQARILGITKDRVAVLIDGKRLAIYDRKGTEVGSSELTAAAPTGPTPRITLDDDQQYALVGDLLVAMSPKKVSVTATVVPSSTEESPSPKPTTSVSQQSDPAKSWTLPKVIGLPTMVGDSLLVPVAGGIAVVNPATGATERTIAVERAGNPARVDLNTVGEKIIEHRGTTVVALSGAN